MSNFRFTYCVLVVYFYWWLEITKTKTNTNYYIIKDVNVNNKRTTQIVERLGNETEVTERASGKDIMTWIAEYIESLNAEAMFDVFYAVCTTL